MVAMQDICLSCYMRFLWKFHCFSKKNRTFAPKCQIHMNTKKVWGDAEQKINITEVSHPLKVYFRGKIVS